MILNINVGVDVWRYHIVSESEILGYVGHVTKEIEEQIKEKSTIHEKW